MTSVKLCRRICHWIVNICVSCRQQGHYDTVDHDIVQGAEDQGVQEEEGGGETSHIVNTLMKLLGHMEHRLRVACTSEYIQARLVYHMPFVAAAVMSLVILPSSAHWWPHLPKIICFLPNIFSYSLSFLCTELFFMTHYHRTVILWEMATFSPYLGNLWIIALKVFQIKALVAFTCGRRLVCDLSNIPSCIIELQSNSFSGNSNTQICILFKRG